MQRSDARLATSERSGPEVPPLLRMVGIVLGVLLVPPFVIPIVLLVMGLGMFAFLPFLPLLLAEFVVSARTIHVAEAEESRRMRDSRFGRYPHVRTGA